MRMSGNLKKSSVIPYWDEIKNWSREDRSNLYELLGVSLKEDENKSNDTLVNKLSPKLMKGLAEYAMEEYREGHCLTQQQVEKEILEEMGWR